MKDKTKKPAKGKQDKQPEKLDEHGRLKQSGNQHNQQRARPNWPNQAQDQNKQG